MENLGRGRNGSGKRGRGRQNRPISGQDGGRGAGRERTIQDHPIQERDTQIASDALIPDLQSLNISQRSPSSSPPEVGERSPVRRPDNGGSAGIQTTPLLVNHFRVNFDPQCIILHYDIDIKPEIPPRHGGVVRLPKFDMRLIKEKLFSDDQTRFPENMTAYDGEKSIYSVVELPTGTFKVEVSRGENLGTRSYTITINLVNRLELSKLGEYFPREILQGMDLVMKEVPSRHYIQKGRNMYSRKFSGEDDLGYGIVASKGFQHSLKPTFQSLILCVDYSVLAFRKPVSVLEFLKEHLPKVYNRTFDEQTRKDLEEVLKGLRVTLTHRRTTQQFTIMGLTDLLTRDLIFTMEDPEGQNPPREVSLTDYYKDKYNKEISFKGIPCLDLSKNNRANHVPMECCVLVEGQRYPKELLDKDRNMAHRYKRIALPRPRQRMETIQNMIRAKDGPCGGEVAQNFGISVSTMMTKVTGRVLGAPDLKIRNNGRLSKLTIDSPDRQWNFMRRTVVEGKQIDRWAILDCTSTDRYNKLIPDCFSHKLVNRCGSLGIYMKKPLFCQSSNMEVLSKPNQLRTILENVRSRAFQVSRGQLQILVCVMTRKDMGYKIFKWICETQIGLVTQCCLSNDANNAKDQNDQYLANLSLKINAKVGGSNFELFDRLPRLDGNGNVMFIGADVNHPRAFNASSPSVAAVVATMNWPAANRYVARICLQEHRTEKIKDFGEMCVELINLYAQLNKSKPEKIVVFRDGVSEGQFDMVLNEELTDLKNAIESDGYSPTITLVVAQKRHKTRLFLKNESEGGRTGNVSPGTVVDTKIVSPRGFDFYLCSHNGILGTSKPTHYHVLWDENGFTSDELQKVINNLCYTFPRCTKPISLVPLVYYADLAAYRGQLYHEALMESRAQGSSTSSSASYATSSSSASLMEDMKYVKLHTSVENSMVFI